MKYRTGIGFDVHAFADDRKLIIGGVEIPYKKGLAGHSDACSSSRNNRCITWFTCIR